MTPIESKLCISHMLHISTLSVSFYVGVNRCKIAYNNYDMIKSNYKLIILKAKLLDCFVCIFFFIIKCICIVQSSSSPSREHNS